MSILNVLKRDSLQDDLTLEEYRRLFERLDELLPELSEAHQEWVVSQVRQVAAELSRQDPLRVV